MASEQGPVATEAPIVAQPAPTSATLSPNNPLQALQSNADRTNPLKRQREATPTPVTTSGLVQPQADLSPNKLARLADSTRYSPAPPLTGQAALEEEQHRKEEEARLYPPDATSENPAAQALSALRAHEQMSRKEDAPSSAQSLDEASRLVQAMTAAVEQSEETSPRAPAGPGNGAQQDAAAAMDVDSSQNRAGYYPPEAPMEEKSTSLSYPGPLNSMPAPPPPPPQRGLSLPMSGAQDVPPRSPSSKKHKCPYCETEFTRHHNLKSHLLTHSQEKPYLCEACQMRFRRLHDLKRHSKLHTGEKPHICPKCDRKFARGDALARHSKGPGGCAGRRTSMDGFAGEDDYDGTGVTDADESMTGIIYDGHEGEMNEEERRRLSLPSIKAQHIIRGQPAEGYVPHSRTYPPAVVRGASAGGLFPPNVPATANTPSAGSAGTAAHTPSTSVSSVPLSAGSASLYSHGMTESPKPLSPSGLQPNHDGTNVRQQRSPSLSTHLQQQQLGRRQSELNSQAAQAPSAMSASGHSKQKPGTAGARSRASNGPPHGGSGDSSANLFSSEQGLWAYIQNLEQRLKEQGERIAVLERAKQDHDAQLKSMPQHVGSVPGPVTQDQAAGQPVPQVAAPETVEP